MGRDVHEEIKQGVFFTEVFQDHATITVNEDYAVQLSGLELLQL